MGSSETSATRAKADDLYPRGPTALPEGFTAPTARYRAEVVLVALGLLVFVTVYLGLVAGCVYLAWSIWQMPVHGRGSVYLLVAGTAVLAAIVVFLVKGLFRTQRRDPSQHVEVTREDEPVLFAFLDRLVADTGAPYPGKVFLSWDVNAAVFYDTSFLSLFFPVRKNLLLGLGLVNHLNLSELKAVLAHELGHFSQRSMKLGSYVYVSNQILDDVIWGRDSFDDLLEGLKRSDPRLAIVGWLIAAVVWVLRKALELIFRLVNVLHRSLMRQMEFAADRVAISVAGSRAMARGLYMAELADACFAQTLQDLTHAGDHGLYTTDLFHHQARALDEVRRLARKPSWGVVPADDARLFEADAKTKPSMWATHPPSSEREDACRTQPVACPVDERSAWLLFEQPERWRKELTQRFVYSVRAMGRELKRLPVDAAEVQRFIDGEREETAVAGRYAEMYEGRPLARLDVEGIVERVALAPASDAEIHDGLRALERRIEELSSRTRTMGEESRLAVQALQGQLREARFQALGREWATREASDALRALDAAQKEIDAGFEEADRRFLELLASLAIRAADGSIDRLSVLYEFLLAVDAMLTRVASAQQAAGPSLDLLFSGRRLEAQDVQQVLVSLTALHHQTSTVLREAANVRVPPLRNLEEVQTLGPFLLEHPLVSGAMLQAGQLDGGYLQALLGSVSEVIDKLIRMKRKALGAILSLQAELVERVRARPSFRPDAAASATEPGPSASDAPEISGG
jgi:Zn-dependent protease with chaperone function